MLLFDLLRLAGACAMLALAACGCVRARRIRTWHLALIATEYGGWFSVLAFTLAIPSAGPNTPTGLAATALASAAGVMLIRPCLLGAWHARRLCPGTFSWKKLFFARAPRAVPPEAHTYIHRDGESPLRLHIRRASNPRPEAPILLYFHSGGWDSGTPHEFPDWFNALAAAGYTTIAAEYRLAPQFPWPAQREDARAALNFLRINSAKLDLPSQRFCLWGRSAGGHIALCTAYEETGAPDITGVAAFYAPTDMFASWYGAYPGDILDSPNLLANFLGGLPRDTHENHRDASPARFAPAGACKTLLIHGGRDELVWILQPRLLTKRLRRVGAPVQFISLPWARHACDHNLRGPAGQIWFASLLEFLEEK